MFVFAENLNPGELKKLRNKQRKAKRKAEMEKQQVAQAQEKREHHNKSRQQTEAELDAPQQDELVPDKLERVSTPLFFSKKISSNKNKNPKWRSFGQCALRKDGVVRMRGIQNNQKFKLYTFDFCTCFNSKLLKNGDH